MAETELFTVQCGEIFISEHSNFRIVCVLCKKYFEDFVNFKEHWLKYDCSSCLISSNFVELQKYFYKEEKLSSSGSDNHNIQCQDILNHSSKKEISILQNSLPSETLMESLEYTVMKECSTKKETKECSDIESTSEDQPISMILNENCIGDVETDCEEMIPATKSGFSCEFCSNIYAYKCNLNEHRRLKHTKEKLFECDLCDKKFGNSTTLKLHKYSHLKEKPHKCKYCNKSFITNTLKKKHERATHEKIKPYKCNLCDKAFTAKHLLQKHDVVHTGEKPYKCSLCLSAYATSYGLFCHTRKKHPEEVPLQCEQCLKRFTTSLYLNKHECNPIINDSVTTSMTTNLNLLAVNSYKRKDPASREILQCGIRIVNSEEVPIYKSAPRTKNSTTPKLFICEHCGKGYQTLFQYEIHKRSHTGERPFQCDECEKGFASKQQLKHHITLHTGEKPYKCTECGKYFRTQFRLRVHIRSHTGERPFKCEIITCNKAFHSLHNLNEHTKNVHKIIKKKLLE